MLIFMLAAAMTLAMLIATAIGLHNESQKTQAIRVRSTDRFGAGRR